MQNRKNQFRDSLGTLTSTLDSQYNPHPDAKPVLETGPTEAANPVDRVGLESAPERVPKTLNGLKTVKEIAELYQVSLGSIYALIKMEPGFPYINVGVKKKFLVDIAQFEKWLSERTKKQKHEHFAVPTALDLSAVFKSKPVGDSK